MNQTTSNAETVSTEERDRLLAQLDASLGRNGQLDAGERETIVRNFKHALDEAPAAAGDDRGQAGPDPRQWAATLDMLHQNQVIDDSDREALMQQFDRSMQVLQSPAVQTATEFARRCESDGETQAREWLTGQLEQQSGQAGRSGDAGPAGEAPVPAHVSMAMRRKR